MSKIHCVGAYQVQASVPPLAETQGFNGHPPLGVNAIVGSGAGRAQQAPQFQWAPTLEGECYWLAHFAYHGIPGEFQWAPTLGGECYMVFSPLDSAISRLSFNGHPPLGVNATLIMLKYPK